MILLKLPLETELVNERLVPPGPKNRDTAVISQKPWAYSQSAPK